MKKILSKKEKETSVKTRNVINHNGSFYICLPMAFVRRHNIQAGDKLAVIMGENLKVVPMERPE